MDDRRQRPTNVLECAANNHQFEFIDSFPGYEIDECQRCGLRKFRNLTSGEETYSRSGADPKSPPQK